MSGVDWEARRRWIHGRLPKKHFYKDDWMALLAIAWGWEYSEFYR